MHTIITLTLIASMLLDDLILYLIQDVNKLKWY